MDTLNRWISLIHPLLEALYYISAVALAILVFKGLEQVKISRKIARVNAKRTAFKLAAEECKYFAEDVVPAYTKIISETATLKLQSFTNPQLKIENGEIVEHNFGMPLLFARRALHSVQSREASETAVGVWKIDAQREPANNPKHRRDAESLPMKFEFWSSF